MIEIGQIIRHASPVAFGALGECVGEKAGIINVGLEGLMLSSAFAASMTALATGNVWVGLAVGMLAGIAVAMLLGLFAITLGQDQIVVGTAINLLALGVCGTLYEQRFGSSGKLMTLPPLPTFKLGPIVGSLDLVCLLLLASIFLTTYLLGKTGWGLAVRATGEYPNSVEAAGYSVATVRYMALGFAGLMGGVAGAYYSLGLANSFSPTTIAGRGFVAIAMVTFGKWKPIWIVLASLLIGLAERLQFDLQTLGSQVPVQLFLAMPYIITIAVLIFVGKGALAPRALGQPYIRQK